MKQKEIDEFFTKNYNEILKFADKIYHCFLREFESTLEAEDFLAEFYIYAVENKYRFKYLSVFDLIKPDFIRTIRYKYKFEITNQKRFNEIIKSLNSLCQSPDFNYSIVSPALYILNKEDYNKKTKNYIKAKKIIKGIKNETM